MFVFRTGDSRGFAFVRYKYADEAQKAIDKLDGQLQFERKLTLSLSFFNLTLLLFLWEINLGFYFPI